MSIGDDAIGVGRGLSEDGIRVSDWLLTPKGDEMGGTRIDQLISEAILAARIDKQGCNEVNTASAYSPSQKGGIWGVRIVRELESGQFDNTMNRLYRSYNEAS